MKQNMGSSLYRGLIETILLIPLANYKGKLEILLIVGADNKDPETRQPKLALIKLYLSLVVCNILCMHKSVNIFRKTGESLKELLIHGQT